MIPVLTSAYPSTAQQTNFPRPLALPATGHEVCAQFGQHSEQPPASARPTRTWLCALGTSLRVFHGTFLDPEIADRYNDVPLDAPYPLSAGARENRLVLLPRTSRRIASSSPKSSKTIAAGVQTTASVPLHRSDGTILGVIGFAWTQPTLFDAKLQAALHAVAHLCIETVERAERYDAEHALIVELQPRLLGHVPEVARPRDPPARYLPASRVPTVGGDWYEGMKLCQPWPGWRGGIPRFCLISARSRCTCSMCSASALKRTCFMPNRMMAWTKSSQPLALPVLKTSRSRTGPKTSLSEKASPCWRPRCRPRCSMKMNCGSPGRKEQGKSR